MNCQKCGTPLEEGESFCTKCGAAVTGSASAASAASATPHPTTAAPVAAPSPAAPQKTGHKGVLIGCGIAAALMLLVGGSIAAAQLLGGKSAPTEALISSAATEPVSGSTPAPSAQPVRKPDAASWVVEPTIEADNIDVMVQGEPDMYAAGTDDDGSPRYESDDNSYLRQYTYPLSIYSKDGKIGIIKYDGAMLADCNYNLYYIGNHAQLLVGTKFCGDDFFSDPYTHDLWAVTEDGVESERYYGGSGKSATVFSPVDHGITAWNDRLGIGNYCESGFYLTNETEYDSYRTGRALYIADLDEWTEYINPDDHTSHYYLEGNDNYEISSVPLYNAKRVGTDAYENVTPCAEGLFGVKKAGKWGYLDTDGNYVFPCEYDSSFEMPTNWYTSDSGLVDYLPWVYAPSDGYLVLSKNGQYALYTSTGEEVIPFGEYEALRPVCGGKLWAKQGGKWGVLELSGAATAESSDKTIALTAPYVPGDPLVPERDATSSEYIFPHSDTEYLTDADLSGLDAATLRLARNEILARHGRKFDSDDLQMYFNGCSWYHGTIPPTDFDYGMLNEVEQANVELIKSYEGN